METVIFEDSAILRKEVKLSIDISATACPLPDVQLSEF